MQLHRIDTASPFYAQAKKLRNEVLRKPLGLMLTPEELALDVAREHIVAVGNGRVIGSVSLYLQEPTLLRIKQMAVDPAQQGHGLGAALMQSAEARGRELGAESALLHARRTVEKFYTKLGYAMQGDEFAEQGIAHIAMIKLLRSSPV